MSGSTTLVYLRSLVQVGAGPSDQHAAALGDRQPGVTVVNLCTFTVGSKSSAVVIWRGLVSLQYHVPDATGSHSQDFNS